MNQDISTVAEIITGEFSDSIGTPKLQFEPALLFRGSIVPE
jgi:hypothetical protein